MNAALAIFVKTPGRSPIKTRLAEGIGTDAALAWYRAAVATCAELAFLYAESGAAVYWAVAEDASMDDPQWAALPRISQGEGGLGARMARVHSELVARHGAGLLIGADSPQLALDDLQTASDWLRNSGGVDESRVDAGHGEPHLSGAKQRIVLGPAHDGGFWLVGANCVLPAADWRAVAYSRSGTAEQFRARMQQHGAWRELRSLSDVDRVNDLAAVIEVLQALPTPRPAQRALLRLSRELVNMAASA